MVSVFRVMPPTLDVLVGLVEVVTVEIVDEELVELEEEDVVEDVAAPLVK